MKDTSHYDQKLIATHLKDIADIVERTVSIKRSDMERWMDIKRQISELASQDIFNEHNKWTIKQLVKHFNGLLEVMGAFDA